MPAPWAKRTKPPKAAAEQAALETNLSDVPMQALRTALGITAEAAGMPGALIKTLNKSIRNETSALSLYAPRTILNQQITGSRRFAAPGGRGTGLRPAAGRASPKRTIRSV